MALFRVLHDINPELLFEPPAFSTSVKSTDGNVPFTEMHDPAPFPYMFFSNVTLGMCNWKRFSLSLSTSSAGRVCANTTLEHLRNAAVMHNTTPSLFEPQTLETMLRSPSMKLQHTAKDILMRMQVRYNTTSFTCLHLRVEPDFKNGFPQRPAYYSTPEILSKVKMTFAKLTLYNKTDVVYIAGNHALRSLTEIYESDIWRHVVTKESFLQFNQTDVPLSVYAALDFEVCKEAALFIGNNHSSWSELLVDYLMWVRRLNRESHIFQVNPYTSHEPDTELLPFCSANHKSRHPQVSCPYYRLAG
jgi:hypothetical protein